MRRTLALILLAGGWLAGSAAARADLDLQFSIVNTSGLFTPSHIQILNDALAKVERMWERAITGYQGGINIGAVPITVRPSNGGLASANFNTTTNQGGFILATSGNININFNEIENFANWQGITTGPCLIPGNGLNFIDELLAHEAGHVLGVGTLWASNSIYIGAGFRYIGQHGLAAYKAEFDPNATWVPVEDAGNPGTPGAHWDQRMRSSSQEGDPNAPWCLDPRVGLTDQYGRDLGLELMTGAIDPDHLEPFLSLFTIESMRDMGYTVTSFADFDGNGVLNLADRNILVSNLGASGLDIDSVSRGDVDRNRVVNVDDLRLWEQTSGIPEPSGLTLAVLAMLSAATSVLSSRRRSLIGVIRD